MKTAINWLLDELKNLSESQLQQKDFQLYMQKQDIIINNAKEKEKEQLEESWNAGMSEGIGTTMANLDYDAEFINYYNQTYNQTEDDENIRLY